MINSNFTTLQQHHYTGLTPAMPLTLSPDGYIRLTFDRFQHLELEHVCSSIDSEVGSLLTENAIPFANSGFTEWQSHTTPVISLGWDWYEDATNHKMLVAPSTIRSNVMLRDKNGYDLGPAMTSMLLHTWLSSFDWQHTLTQQLNS
ncbi:DUF4902 domain-containing protein [Ampullimonas aquatilis]|uniref:DUF4902 domain-containing protein n=1 Tax=Ampullimonas aquatilis TaxID=1341549 RepID=UPI003C75F6E3